MRSFWLAFALLACGVSVSITAQEEEEGQVILPRQMGAINDYAGVLGGARAGLQSQLDGIKGNFDVQFVILATIFDPFDKLSIYAQRIWESWKLGERTALLVFSKEQPEDRWAFEIRLSEDLRSTFRPEHLDRLHQGLTPHLERKRVKTAIEEAVTALQAMLDGSYGQPPLSPSLIEFNWYWILITLGGLIMAGGLVLGLRVFVRSRCPRCGARLRPYRRASYGPRGDRVGYISCPHCGYARRSP